VTTGARGESHRAPQLEREKNAEEKVSILLFSRRGAKLTFPCPKGKKEKKTKLLSPHSLISEGGRIPLRAGKKKGKPAPATSRSEGGS